MNWRFALPLFFVLLVVVCIWMVVTPTVDSKTSFEAFMAGPTPIMCDNFGFEWNLSPSSLGVGVWDISGTWVASCFGNDTPVFGRAVKAGNGDIHLTVTTLDDGSFGCISVGWRAVWDGSQFVGNWQNEVGNTGGFTLGPCITAPTSTGDESPNIP